MKTQKRVANYTIIIEKQKRMGTNKICYVAYVPILGIAADADTIEEVEKEIKSLIEFHLESLVEEGEEIPIEKDALVARSEVNLPKGALIMQ